MKKFRIYSVAAINIVAVLYLLKVVYLDKTSDVVGVFILITLLFLLFYNFYIWIIYFLLSGFKENLVYIKGVYLILLVFPLLILWYLTR
jgi:hypothetical protein